MEHISRLKIQKSFQWRIKNILGVMILLSMIFSPAAIDRSNYEYIEIVYLKKKPIIKGLLNGKEAFFLLDTGSDITFLHHKVSRHYAFKANYLQARSPAVHGIGTSATEMMYAYNVNLILGSQRIKAKYRSQDISNIVNSIYSHSSIRIAGIIGSDVMRNYGFKIDYRNKMVGIDVLPTKSKKYARN